MILGREYKDILASPDDAIALFQGHAYTVRYGKQCLGHFSTQKSAAFEAGRQDAKAYKIESIKGKHGASSRVVLVPIEELSTVDTPAENIARKVIEHIGATNGPVSPLAKQRVVALLHSMCDDKDLSEEVFLVIYPASNKDQFLRMWNNIAPAKTITQNPVNNNQHVNNIQHANNNQSNKRVSIQTNREKLLDYSQTRGFEQITEAMLMGNLDKCADLCVNAGIEALKFEELINYSVDLGILTIEQSDKIKNSVLKHIARNSVEKRINNDIMSFIKKNPRIVRMAAAADVYGISQELINSGYGKREADELAAEIVSLSKMLIAMK